MGNKESRWSRAGRIGYEKHGLAVARTLFQKRESHKISYRSGHRNTKFDLLIVRRQQIWRVRDCKIIADEQVTTQREDLDI